MNPTTTVPSTPVLRAAWMLVLAALTLPSAALAQSDAEVQRLMQQSSAERDRQSDFFALQVQQQQRSLAAPAADPAALVAREMQERREFLRLLEAQRQAEREAPATVWGPRLDLRPQHGREREAELDRARLAP